MIWRQCRKSQGFAIRASEGKNFKTGRSVRLLGSVGTRRALEARLSDKFLQRVIRKFVNLNSRSVCEFSHGLDVGGFQLLDLSDSDSRHLHQMIGRGEERLCMRSPTTVFSSWLRFWTICQIAGEPVIHREETGLYAEVVVEEVLDAKLYPLLVTENDPEF